MDADKSARHQAGDLGPAEELLRIERDLGIGLSVAESLFDTLRPALEAALRIPPIECGGVYLVDEATGGLTLKVHHGVSEALAATLSTFRADDPEMKLLLSDRSLYGLPEELVPRLAEVVGREGIRAVAIIPVKHQNRPVGGLALGARSQSEIPPFAREALESISARLGGVVSRVEAEEAVIRAKEQWEQTFDAVPDLIAIVDRDYRIMRINKAMADRLGMAPEQCVGAVCYRSVHGTEQPPPFCPHQQLLADGQEHTVEIDLPRLGGTFLVTASPLCDSQGRLYASVHVARDITERKLAEVRLRDSEKRLRTIFENASDVITYVDAAGRILDVNERVEEVLGYKREEILGRNFVALETIRPDDVPRLVDLFLKTLEKGRAMERVELELKHRSGGSVHVDVGTRFIKNGGVVKEIVSIFRDVTDRKRAEMELARAKQAAEAASRAKSEFLANVSHEIRTPLTAIIGFADLLISSDSTADERRAHVETIHRNAKNLLALINDILDLSKIEAEKIEIKPIEFPPWKVVGEVASLMRLRAAEKKLDLSVDYHFPLPAAIRTDPVRLRQILVNLVGNAVKFTDSGGVRISVRCAGPPGTLARMEFAVSDTGVGIQPEELGRLCEPFTQLDASAARRHGGTGLGLSISQRLAAMLGGRIEAASQPGKGSPFTVSIDPGPLDDAAMLDRLPPSAGRQEEPLEPSIERPLGGRVLVIEDSRDVRQLVRLVLEQSGVDVDLAEDGLSGCDLAIASLSREDPYDLILMDIQMPVMDGYEAARQLRRQGWRGPIVALTAHTMAGDRQRCLEAGCDDYVGKPLRLEELLTAVGRFLPALSPPPAAPPPEAESAAFLTSSRFSDAQKAMLSEQFLESLRERTEEVRRALEEDDQKLLCKAAHALHGTAGLVGFDEIARLARQVEEQARAGESLDRLQSSAEELLSACRQAES